MMMMMMMMMMWGLVQKQTYAVMSVRLSLLPFPCINSTSHSRSETTLPVCPFRRIPTEKMTNGNSHSRCRPLVPNRPDQGSNESAEMSRNPGDSPPRPLTAPRRYGP